MRRLSSSIRVVRFILLIIQEYATLKNISTPDSRTFRRPTRYRVTHFPQDAALANVKEAVQACVGALEVDNLPVPHLAAATPALSTSAAFRIANGMLFTIPVTSDVNR